LKCPKCFGWMENRGIRAGNWTCKSCGFALPSNVSWIILVSVDDVNYKAALSRLTEDELDLCFQMETRRTSLQRLRGEKKRRELGFMGVIGEPGYFLIGG